MQILFGYFCAVLVGVVLGLIGGGGSILTVPILVYFLHIEPVAATAYSLFIVGIAALAGFVSYARQKQVDFRTAMFFGVPSICAVFLMRKYVIHTIPAEILKFDSFVLTRNTFIMMLFSVIMILAASSMIRKGTNSESNRVPSNSMLFLMLIGFGEGTVTGFVGAGGGFLIVPALALIVGLDMKTTIGTSLLIISLKSMVGFSGDLMAGFQADWHFLGIFSACAVAGIMAGTYMSRMVEGSSLKKFFGWFVLVIALSILCKEFLAFL